LNITNLLIYLLHFGLEILLINYHLLLDLSIQLWLLF